VSVLASIAAIVCVAALVFTFVWLLRPEKF
jgi:hypothetical protein